MFCTGIVCETSFEFKGLMCHDGGGGAWVVLDTGKVFFFFTGKVFSIVFLSNSSHTVRTRCLLMYSYIASTKALLNLSCIQIFPAGELSRSSYCHEEMSKLP